MAVTFHLVRKHAHVPLLHREAVAQCRLSTERDEINMSGGDTCNAVMSGQHTPSLQRGQLGSAASAQKCYLDIKYQESGLSADLGASERSI